MDTRDSAPQLQNHNTTAAKSQDSPRRIFIFVSLLIVLAAGGLAGWYISRTKSQNNLGAVQPYIVQYPRSQGTGFSFDKPSTLIKPASVKTTSKEVILTKTDKNGRTAAGIFAVSEPLPKQNIDLDKFNQALASGNLTDYQSIVTSLQRYAASGLPGYKLTFNKPVSFTSPNIKTDAISLTFGGAPKSTSDKAIDGKVAVALSAKADYSFVIYATHSIWQANQMVWGQVTDSLKIDQ
jgi:hypothetical protein